jgi:hypothetical protein
MKSAYLIGAVLLIQAPLGTSLAIGQERPLARAEQKGYDACLYAAWVDDYCRYHSWSIFVSYERAFRACISANKGGRFPVERPGLPSAENYCWTAVHESRHY